MEEQKKRKDNRKKTAKGESEAKVGEKNDSEASDNWSAGRLIEESADWSSRVCV